ncbi:MAG: hypothetical protein DHS20C13_28640 [Thermodesulfobacteriota bacterium]|nr:MAG: hypothetical protein DHS20C13_28640 [Thermodesulfobacteriota bacterium]
MEFNAGFEYKCLECDRSYVLSQNKENCVLDTMATIAYCAKSYINDDSDKVCTQCISNYTLNEDGQACCATELEFYNGEEC